MRESCPGPEMIGTYLEGGLPEAERDELEAHAAECEDCAAVVAAAGGQAQAVQLSEAFEKRILGVFPKTKGGTSRRRVPRRRARPAVLPRAWFLTAAMAAAVLLVGFAIFGGKPEARRAGKEPERESVVAEAPAPGEEIAREAVRTVAAPAPEEVKRDETTLAVLEPTEEAALTEAPAEEPEGIRAPEETPELAAVPERESETEEPMARVARVRGLVMYARGAHGRWARASEGIGLLSGDRLDTRTGAARIDLDGAVVCANSRTVLVLSAVPAQAGVARARPGAPAVAVELTRGDILVKDEGLRVSVRVVGGPSRPWARSSACTSSGRGRK